MRRSFSHPNPRIGDTIHTLCQEDKFEVCLNLSPLVDSLMVCREHASWHTYLQDPSRGPTISAEATAEFEQYDLSPQDVGYFQVSPLIPARIEKTVISKAVLRSNLGLSATRDLNQQAAFVTKHSLYIQHRHMLSCTLGKLQDLNRETFSKWVDKIEELPREVHNALAVVEDLQEVLNGIKKLQERVDGPDKAARAEKRHKGNRDFKPIRSLNGQYIVMKEFVVLEFQQATWILPFVYFLEVYGKLTEMMNLLIYIHYSAGTSMPDNHWEVSLCYMRHCVDMLLRRRENRPCLNQRHQQLVNDNAGFVYLKTMEALGVGIMSLREDMENFQVENRLLLDTMWQALVDDHIVSSTSVEDSDLYQIWWPLESEQISDLMGIVKVFGHPTISVIEGLQQLEERVHKELDLDPVALRNSLGIMVRDLHYNFYRRHKRYPIVDEATLTADLASFLNSRLDPTIREGKVRFFSIGLEDWSRVMFEQNSEFDMAENQLRLIKDKAIGLPRSAVLKRFLLPIDSRHRTKPQNRRALLSYLMTPDFSEEFQDYLGQYMAGDDFNDEVLEYLVMKLTAKELELKEKGRFFGASPMVERIRRQIQEKNTMSLMDRYVPEQLLTPGELDGIHKIVAFKKLASSTPDTTVVHVSADFSSWNHNFRRETVDDTAGVVLDAWFGSSHLYRKTMLAYQRMLVYYDDRTYRIYWNGQLGGIEGQNQATWTLMFLAGLKESMEKIGYRYHITVKGDDVRMSILIPTSELRAIGFSNLRRRLMDEMRDKCTKMGWQLNPNESFVSLSILCTSKQYLVQDTWLPSAAKKIMKCGAVTNVVFPTLVDHVATVYSVAHSACAQSTVCLPTFVTACYVAARLLSREMYAFRLTKEQILVLNIWPQILGGPGALPLQTFFIRGENDMLSCSISLLRMIDLVILDTYELDGLNTQAVRMACRSILNQPLEDPPNYKQLLLDPYAICIAHPPRPTTILKKSILDALRHHCQHPDIIELLAAEMGEFDDELCTALLSIEPCCPKLLSALWECSPTFLVGELISKFLQSQTVVTFLMIHGRSHRFRGSRPRVLDQMVSAHNTLKAHWARVLRVVSSDTIFLFGTRSDVWNDLSVCSTTVTQLIRDTVWRRPLHGITYPSVVDQLRVWIPNDPAAKDLENARSAGHIIKISLRTKTARAQVFSKSDHYKVDASCKSNFGSKTDSRVHIPDWPRELDSEPALRLHKLLIISSSMSNMDDNVGALIDRLMSILTKNSPVNIRQLCDVHNKSQFHHRVPTHHYKTTTMPNYKPNLSNIISINFNECLILQQSSTKMTINYSALRYILTPLALWPLQASQNIHDDYPDVLHACLDYQLADIYHGRYRLCKSCCASVEDRKLTLKRRHLIPVFQLSGVRGVRCTSAEENSLKAAVVSKMAQQLTTPTTIHEIREILNCGTQAALCMLNQRLQLHSFQVIQATSQIGSDQNLIGDSLESMCTGMGVQSPTEQVPNLATIGLKFPLQASSIFLQQLYHYYLEIYSSTPLDHPEVNSIAQQLAYKQRSKVLIGQLHRANLLVPCIDLLNSRQPPHTAVQHLSAGDRRSEQLTNQLFTAFRSSNAMWSDHFNGQTTIRPVIEARSIEEYVTSANLVCNLAQRYTQHKLLTAFSLTSWSEWYSRVIQVLDEIPHLKGAEQRIMNRINDQDQFLVFAFLVGTLETPWVPPPLSIDELNELIEDQGTLFLLSPEMIISTLSLGSEERMLLGTSSVYQTFALVAGPRLTNLNLRRSIVKLRDLIYWSFETDFLEEHPPIQGVIERYIDSILHITQRRVCNASSESLLMYLDEQPEEQEEASERINLAEISITQFRETSPNATIRTLVQMPGPDTCSREDMMNFLRELTHEARPLIKTAISTRNIGLVSSSEPFQMAMIHAIRYCRAQPIDKTKSPGVVVLGNTSGFIARAYIELYNRDIVIALSNDVRVSVGSVVPVFGNSSSQIPPELIGISTNPAFSSRIVYQHGIDGDIVNRQPTMSHDLKLRILGASIRIYYLDLTNIDPSLQLEALRNTVKLQQQTQTLGTPIRALWRMDSISFDSVVRFLSLGTASSFEIIGPEYLTIPLLSCTIRVINGKSLTTLYPALPMVIRSAMTQAVRNAAQVGTGTGRIASDDLISDLRISISSRISQIIPHPSVVVRLHLDCVCQTPRCIDESIGDLCMEQLREIHAIQMRGPRCVEAVQEEFIQIKVILQTLGLQVCMASSGDEMFQHVAADTLIEAYKAMFPQAFLETDTIIGDKAHHTDHSLTPDDHELTLSRHEVSIKAHNLSVDLMHEYNLGIAKGFDILLACLYARILPGSEPEVQKKTLDTLWEGLDYHECCHSIPVGNLLDGMAARKRNIQSWKRVEFKNRVLIDNPAVRAETPERGYGVPAYENSPVYHPESPVYQAHPCSPQYHPASPE